MNPYEVLGVSPEAEPAVISAAFKALVRIYHPDSYSGDKTYANQRLKEINAAWDVLSNPKRKAEYDLKRHKSSSGKTKSSKGDAGPTDADFDEFAKAIKEDWNYAASFYPDLIFLHKELDKIDRQLGFLFQAYLVENKAYETRKKIANQFQQRYLEEKFGSNKKIQGLALQAIQRNHRNFAHDLNVALKHLGTSSAETILENLSEKYP